jgi:pyruvate ferredoxin oxidoreductase delta subunit
MIRRVEINYRGVFQKRLAKKIGGDVVRIASQMGKVGFSNGRYSDAPERSGIPSKYFAFVSSDLSEEELEAECGAELDIDQADVSIVLDDTLVKGVEPWAWSGIRPINENLRDGGTLVVVTRRTHEDLLKHIPGKPRGWRLATYEGSQSFSGMWVFRDDFTHERTLGAIAAAAPDVMTIEAVEACLNNRHPNDPTRAEAARRAFDEVVEKMKTVVVGTGVESKEAAIVLPKWFEFGEGTVVAAVPRGFEMRPSGQSRNQQYKRGTTRSQRPIIRFDLCTKCALCWLECPDESFDPVPDGLYDVNYTYCVGCGKCAQVCPVQECIVMIDELEFDDESSPWETFSKDRHAYVTWAEDKKSLGRLIHSYVPGSADPQTVKGERIPPKHG